MSSFALQDYPPAKRPHSGGDNYKVGKGPKSGKGHRHKYLPVDRDNKGYFGGEGDWKRHGKEDGGGDLNFQTY